MKFQKWLLIGSAVILVGVVALAGLSFAAPFARAQGPGDWYGGGGGDPMFDGGFGPQGGMDQAMMPGGDAFGPGFGPGPGGPGQMGQGGRQGGNPVLEIVAEKLGMTSDELMTELQAGKSIADVAAEKNVSVDTLVDAILAPRSDRLKEMVTNGRLTQEQADARLAEMKSKVTERLNQQGLGQGSGQGMMGGMGGGRLGEMRNQVMSIVTEKLGMTQAELMTELQAGKSIADVAKEKNVAVGDIAEAILAPQTDKLKELVTDGQLTQAEVDNYLANRRVEVVLHLNQNRASQKPASDATPDESENN
jgi:DNA-directed RNA polymerase specialized sigma subunit